MEQQEINLIKNCQKNKPEDFALLYDRYVKKIYDFIYFKTYHKESAEDLTSQTFIKALENINSFNFAKGSFSTWLYRIAQNTVIDHWRTRKQDRNIEDIFDLSSSTDLAIEIEQKEQLEAVRQYLKQFKSQQRDIVIMRLWQNLSYKEIADIMDLSEANCKMIYSRTLNKLREKMPLAVFLTFLLIKYIIH